MKRTPVYTDDMIPAGATCIQRYVGIGPHEVEAHGLQVAGINLGMLA